MIHKLAFLSILVFSFVLTAQAQNVTRDVIQRGDKVADGGTHSAVKFAVINVDGADADAIIAAVAGKKLRVLGYVIKCSGAVNLTWQDGAAAVSSGVIPLTANGDLGIIAPISPTGWFETATAGQTLVLLKSGAVSCDGHLTYVEVD